MSAQQVADTIFRAPTLDDLEPVVELINVESLRFTGSLELDLDALRGWWTQPPPFDLARDVLLAEQDGVIVGKMSIDLEGRSFEPSFPVGTQLRMAVESEDEELRYDLNERTFADHWGFMPTRYEEWLHWLRALGTPDPTLWTIATIDGEPAGLTLCRRDTGDPHSGWISTLGVLPAYRGRGLGTALLLYAFAEFRRRGRTRAGLGVDAENVSGAVRLYERAGMRVVRKQDTWERAL